MEHGQRRVKDVACGRSETIGSDRPVAIQLRVRTDHSLRGPSRAGGIEDRPRVAWAEAGGGDRLGRLGQWFDCDLAAPGSHDLLILLFPTGQRPDAL